MSRVFEAALEEGFEFENSGEMLSAIYDSLVYGRKTFASNGMSEHSLYSAVSFSLGMDAGTNDPRDVADAFRFVEKMKPVEVNVPQAYMEDHREAARAIREKYRELQQKTGSDGYSFEMEGERKIKVGGKGWREVKNHSADRRNLAAIARLEELCKKAKYMYSAKNTDTASEKKKRIARFHYYLTKANFTGYSEFKNSKEDLAYVNIVVSELVNGDFFYDLDSSDVESVNKNRGISDSLPATRVPNTERTGEIPHKGRVHLLKEYVNYVDEHFGNKGGEVPAPTLGVSSDELSSLRSFVEKEKGAIKEQAQKDGSFMKAPNGEPTNLTEDQWLTVRTKAFKNWFGDWENDSENSSKVIDENGEPMVVYHGTMDEFNEFDFSRAGENYEQYGIDEGFMFFSSVESEAGYAVDSAIEAINNRKQSVAEENGEEKENIDFIPYEDARIMPVFLNLRNPFMEDFNEDHSGIWDLHRKDL